MLIDRSYMFCIGGFLLLSQSDVIMYWMFLLDAVALGMLVLKLGAIAFAWRMMLHYIMIASLWLHVDLSHAEISHSDHRREYIFEIHCRFLKYTCIFFNTIMRYL